MAKKKTVSSVSTKQMYTTGSGAKQYGSEADIKKHEEIAFQKFIKNPTLLNLEILERMGAARNSSISKRFKDRFGNDDDMAKFFDKLESRNISAAKKQRAKSLFRKMAK